MLENTLGSVPVSDADASNTTPTLPLAPELRLHPDVTAYVDDAGLIQDPVLSPEAKEQVVAKKPFDPTDPNQLPAGKTPFFQRFPRGVCWPETP